MAKRTSLYDIELGAGARFGEWFGWEVPARFSDLLLEYRAVRATSGLIDRSYRGIIELTGKDRTRFLNGMITNDVGLLKEGDGLYAAVLTTHGKIIADMRVYAEGDAYWLDLQEARIPEVRRLLDRHLIADRVEIRERSADFALLALEGPGSADILTRLGVARASGLAEYQHTNARIDGTAVRVMRAGETGEQGFVLAVPATSAGTVWTTLLHAGTGAGVTPVGMEAANVLRIEAGIPWYGSDMDETNFLQEAGLERAASFTKGCYIGQETVARIKYRGHVNRHLVGLYIHGAEVPAPGATLLFEQKEVGRITSAVWSPALNRPIALGYVRRERKEPRTVLEVNTPKGVATAEVTSLPFVPQGS
jgi:glycine cleavage system T protein